MIIRMDEMSSFPGAGALKDAHLVRRISHVLKQQTSWKRHEKSVVLGETHILCRQAVFVCSPQPLPYSVIAIPFLRKQEFVSWVKVFHRAGGGILTCRVSPILTLIRTFLQASEKSACFAASR